MFKSVIDQMGRRVNINSSVFRIVSLVPSQTELLVDLGLKKQLVGITKFCIHPAELRKEITIVGGTKNVSLEVIQSLKPDLIIGNKEENERGYIEVLEKHFPVWMSDVNDRKSAIEMIRSIGEITNVQSVANELIRNIELNFNQLNCRFDTPKRVLYLIWRNPYLAAGSGTFISDFFAVFNWENCINTARYPEVDFNEMNPDIILLSSEPYPFKAIHIGELKAHFPDAKVVLVDGEYFSWYGSRMLNAPNYFYSLAKQIEAS